MFRGVLRRHFHSGPRPANHGGADIRPVRRVVRKSDTTTQREKREKPANVKPQRKSVFAPKGLADAKEVKVVAEHGYGKRGGVRDAPGTATAPRKGQEVAKAHFIGHPLSATTQQLSQAGTGFSSVHSILDKLEVVPKSHELASAYSRLLNTYAHSPERNLELMEDIFSKFLSRSKPRLTHYTLMMTSYKDAGKAEDCMRVFEHLKARSQYDKALRPDTTAYNIALSTRARLQGDLAGAWELFKEMKEVRREIEEADHKNADELLLLEDDSEPELIAEPFLDGDGTSRGKRTLKGLPLPAIPDKHTYSTMVWVAGQQGMPDRVDELLDECTDLFGPQEVTLMAGVHALGRCGDVAGAERTFQRIVSLGIKPKSVVYHMLLSAHAQVGNADAVRSLLQRMKQNKIKIKPEAYYDLMTAYAVSKDLPSVVNAFSELEKSVPQVTRQHFMNLLDCVGYCGSPAEHEALVDYAIMQPSLFDPMRPDDHRIKLAGFSPHAARAALNFWFSRAERAYRAGEDIVPSTGVFIITGNTHAWWRTPPPAYRKEQLDSQRKKGVLADYTTRDGVMDFLRAFKPRIEFHESKPGVFHVAKMPLYNSFASRRSFVKLDEKASRLVNSIRQAHGIMSEEQLVKKRLPLS